MFTPNDKMQGQRVNTWKLYTSIYFWAQNFMIHRLVKFIISTAIGARTYDLSDFCRTFKIWRSKCKKHLFLCSFARWTRICSQKIHISCISVKIIVFMKATPRIFFSHFVVLAPWLTTSKPCNFWFLHAKRTLL